MRGLIRTILLFIAFLVLSSESLLAWPWDAPELVTVNDQKFTVDDFKHWWSSWKEKDTVFPDTLDSFIDWHLLAQEASIMELFRVPTYKSKLQTFLKVRALLALKQEEVDSKITISESEIRAKYNSLYNPVWKARFIYFNSKEEAEKSYSDIVSGMKTFQSLALEGVPDAPAGVEERSLIPQNFANVPQWLDVFQNLAVGDVSAPLQMGHLFVLAKLIEKTKQEDSHYDSVRKKIHNELWKKQQALYTARLMKSLKEKYHVQINPILLEKALMTEIPHEDLTKPLITTDRAEISLKVVVDKIRREKELMTRVALTDERLQQIRDGIISGIISQLLIEWESLERHYEEKPPLKWIYEFYKQHRLIKEFERRLHEQIVIKDDEIDSNYQAHIDHYMQPQTMNFVMIKGEDDLMNKIWIDITRGEDLFVVSRRYFFQDPPIQNLPVNAIDSQLSPIIEGLNIGEISRPFPYNSQTALVKLLNKKRATPKPLEEVADEISEQIRKERFEALKSDYLTRLKNSSSIRINDNNWNSLKGEFGDTHASD